MLRHRYILRHASAGVPFVAEVHLSTDVAGRRHEHAEIQLLLALEGVCRMELDGRAIDLRPGDVIAIAPHVPHEVPRDVDGPPLVLLDVRLDAEGSPIGHAALGLGSDRLTLGLEQAGSIRSQLAAATRLADAAQQMRILAAVWTLLAAMSESATPAPGSRGSPDRRLGRACQFMLDRLDQPIALREIAAAVGLSQSQLTRLFARSIGVAPAAHLRRLRIERARELLASTNLSVKEVTTACGFACPNHFSRVFRSLTGQAPGEWKQRAE